MAFFATASGLTMDKVRSTAMQRSPVGILEATQETRLTFYFNRLLPECRARTRTCLAVRLPSPKDDPRPGKTGSSCQRSVSLASGVCKPDPRTVSSVVSFILCGVGARCALPRTFFPEYPCALLENPEPVRVLS